MTSGSNTMRPLRIGAAIFVALLVGLMMNAVFGSVLVALAATIFAGVIAGLALQNERGALRLTARIATAALFLAVSYAAFAFWWSYS